MDHAMTDPNTKDESQLDKFKKAARALESDEDEARWEDRLRKVAKAKPHLNQNDK